VLTPCQPSTVWCSRERLPAAAAQPAKVRQSCRTTDLFFKWELAGIIRIVAWFKRLRGHAGDSRRHDFDGIVPILRAVFRVPHGYTSGHTFVPLFEVFGLH
jgi:hypothetical protein